MPFRITINARGAAGSGATPRPLSASLVIPGLQGGAEQSKIVENLVRQWAQSTLEQKVQEHLAGKSLNRRTGNLAARTFVGFQPRGFRSIVSINTTDVPYGAIHEFGGVIRAKRKQYLSIPLPAALTPAGVKKMPLPEWEPTFLRRPKSSSKADWVVFLRNRDRTATPIFLLQKSVEMPARQWASNALDEALPDLELRLQSILPRA